MPSERPRSRRARRNLRAATVAATGLLAVIASAGFGTPALRPLGVVLILIGGFAALGVGFAARNLRIQRTLERTTITVGEPLRATVQLSGLATRSGLLHVLDWQTDVAAPAGTVTNTLRTVRGNGAVRQLVAVTGVPRGEHVLSGPWVALSDPFGLVRVRRVVTTQATVLALARTVPVGLPFWEGATRRSGNNSGRVRGNIELGGIRDYEPGDPLSLIHWTQTARRGRLQTKELHGETGRGRRMTIILDASAPGGDQQYQDAFELAVSAAASLVVGCAARGTAVGLAHAATPPADWPVASAVAPMERALATVRPNATEPVGALIRSIANRQDAPDLVVVVSANDDRTLTAAAAAARASGVTVAAVLIQAARHAAQPLRRSGVIVSEVARFDDLAPALDLMASSA